MEDEVFLSGYCRAQDGPRRVTAELYGGRWEADCAYPDCPFQKDCPIARQLGELKA